MKTQFDHQVRVVSLENLKAMCERISGTCRTYQVSKVTTNRVHVEYSNPSEYGTPNPRTAVYPCWHGSFDYGKDNPTVALDLLGVLGTRWDDYCHSQMFWPLTDCEPLYRSIDSQVVEKWETEYEIYARKYSYALASRWYQSCIQFWHVEGLIKGDNDTNGLALNLACVGTWTLLFPGDAELKYDQRKGEYRDYRDAQRAVVEHCKKLEGREV